MSRLRVVVAIGSLLLLGGAAWAQPQPRNIVVIVADDLGVDSIGMYQPPGATVANTPTLDYLARSGIMFRNAWSNPVCATTRATIQTGRYAHRTGVHGPTGELPDSEYSIPEVLAMDEELDYRSALFGKWGLAKRGTPSSPGTLDPDRHPVSAGYDLFQGVPFCCFGPEEDYIDWFKSFAKFDPTSGCDRNIFSWHYDPDCIDWGTGPPNATPTKSDDYATAVNVADARAWLADPSIGEPWFLVVSFNAAHSPYHHPSNPSGACSDPGLCYREMIQAMDARIFELLVNLDPAERARTTVLFVGDNGNPLDSATGKNTLYQGGINVPLIAWGAGVVDPGLPEVVDASDALVNTSDLFMTVLELAGVDAEDLPTAIFGPLRPWHQDSYSLVPILEGTADEIRHFAYAETRVGHYNGKTIRDRAGFKLTLINDGLAPAPARHFFYNLASQAGESQNLVDESSGQLVIPDPVHQAALDGLNARIGADPEGREANYCTSPCDPEPPCESGCQLIVPLFPPPPPPNLPAANLDLDADGVAEDGFPGGYLPCADGQILGCDDNCQTTPNPDQADTDGDHIGDACEECQNGVDDDGDGAIDYPEDPGCRDAEWIVEDPACENGLDDDGDGFRDSDGAGLGSPDPACDQAWRPSESSACQDGRDNEGDGLKDFDGGQSIHGACSNGVCPNDVSDPNDDGVADPDPECSSAADYSEYVEGGCGLGMELVLLAPLLARLRRLRRRAA